MDVAPAHLELALDAYVDDVLFPRGVAVLRILVNGQEPFLVPYPPEANDEEWSRRDHGWPEGDFMAMSPFELLGGDELVPTSGEPKSAVIAKCKCGSSGCSRLRVTIRRDGNQIVWSDYSDGIPEDSYEGVLQPFGFDAEQYLTEVDRAKRAWMSTRPQK